MCYRISLGNSDYRFLRTKTKLSHTSLDRMREDILLLTHNSLYSINITKFSERGKGTIIFKKEENDRMHTLKG